MADYGGIAKTVPVLTFFMMLSVVASAGLPGLNGFVGEFMILIGSWDSAVVGNPILIAVATTGVIFAAVYLLWMVYKTFFGEVTNEANAEMKDLNGREIGLLLPLAALMVILGFYPAPFLDLSERGIQSVLQTVEAKRVAVEAAPAGQGVSVEIVWPDEIVSLPAEPETSHSD